MAGEGLVELARRFVELSDELEGVRGEIRKAVLNGTGGSAPRPTPARSKPGNPRGPQHPKTVAAAEAETRILSLLRATPGMGTMAIARATGAKRNTTVQRLQRLRARGEVQGGGGDGWTASP
jgi:hypothetical protein